MRGQPPGRHLQRVYLEPQNRVAFLTFRDQLSLDDPPEVDEILRRLAAAVILQAMKDAAGRRGINYKQIAEAKAWLLDEENEIPWFEMAGIERKHILAWFEAGCKNPREFRLGVEYKKDPKKKRYCNYELQLVPPGETALLDPDLGIEY